jgi:hypothetical protein
VGEWFLLIGWFVFNLPGKDGRMRQIIIIFKQEDKELVACRADFGNPDEASDLENKLADASQALIATALKKLPANLIAEGYGPTKEGAEIPIR